MRSGRFDRKVYVGLPDADGRKKLFKKYLKNIKLASEPDLDKLAKSSVNFSGADIAAAANEAAIIADAEAANMLSKLIWKMPPNA